MIIAVDSGIGTFGWAVVTPGNGAVRDCGVIVSKPDPKLGKHDDRVRRVSAQAAMLRLIAGGYRITAIAAETMSFAPRSSAAAKIGIGMSWGNLIGFAAALGVPLYDVPPKTWQRAIVPAAVGEPDSAAIDYERVAAELADFVDARALGIDEIAKGQRNHAFDAIGVGVYAALKFTQAKRSTCPAQGEAA